MFQFNFGNSFGKNYREVPPEGEAEQPKKKRQGKGAGLKNAKRAGVGLLIGLLVLFLGTSCWYTIQEEE